MSDYADIDMEFRNYRDRIADLEARIEALEAALKPFAQNVKAVSLSKALGHITREHLLNARAALDKDAGQ
jgi:prefoldin subunit 5